MGIKSKKPKVMALIPARGGSKSIPLKNITPINNKPLIFYTAQIIKKNLKFFDYIICSTDNKKIKEVLKSYEFIEIVDRPKKLSTDNSKIDDTIHHSLNLLRNRKKDLPDYIFLFQPTSPLILKSHVEKIVSQINESKKFDSIQTVCEIEHNNHAFNQRKIKSSKIDFVFKNERLKLFNKQKKPKFYRFANLICFKVKSFLKNNNIFGDKSIPIIVERVYGLDIESKDDVNYCEYLIKRGVLKK